MMASYRRHLLTVFAMLSLISLSGNCEGQEKVKKIVVGTRNIPPFAMKNDEDAWNGVSISLWKAIAEDLNVDYEFREYSEVSGLLSAVESSEVDIGVAAITITAEREKRIDFTMPFYTSGIGVAIRKSDEGSTFSAIATMLTTKIVMMVLAILALLIIVGLLAWLFERKKNTAHFDRTMTRGIWDGFWFAAVTMTTVGYGDKSPKTVPGRVLALVWMFVGLVMISLFTAAAASALTEARLTTRIQNSADLLKYRCGTIGDSTSGRFLTSENISYRDFDKLDDAISALLQGDIDACIYDAPTLRYFSHTKFGGGIQVLPVRFQSASYAFALPPKSEFRELVNQTLLNEIESDEWPIRVERLLGR